MSLGFEDDENPKQGRIKPICKTCGGYGYNFNTEAGNARKCDSCGGDRISRDPRDYANKNDIPPLPRR